MFVRKKSGNKLLKKNAIKYFQFDIQRFVNIYNEKSNTLISGTSDHDSIYSSIGDESTPTEKVTLDGGAGNDTIDNESAISLIDAGDGNDYISNAYFGVRATIKSGLGNDKIENAARGCW